MVHGVMDEKIRTDWVPLRPQMSRSGFENVIKRLSKYYRFVSMDEAVDMLAGRKPVIPRTLVMTFDDGYRNQVKHALPILQRYKVPAMVFLATGHVDNRKPFWFDRLDYALQHAELSGKRIKVGCESIEFRSNDRDEVRRSYKRLRTAGKRVRRDDLEFTEEMEKICARLEIESGKRIHDIFEEDDWSSVLTWEEIREAAMEGVSFGSHTVDHVRLGLVGEKAAREQMLRSKNKIEEESGRPCRFLCYPNGSFNSRSAKIARECGYEAGVSTLPGLNTVGEDLMALRRISLDEQTAGNLLIQHVSMAVGPLKLVKRRLGGREFGSPSVLQELGD
jgi:peptidoglycan/xylan/chitin deacetylase (PgdA/CDA1 family)